MHGHLASPRRFAPPALGAAFRALALSGALATGLTAVEQAGGEATVTLPTTCDIAQLTDLVARSTGVSFQFGVGKVSGSVRLAVAAPVSNKDLWSIYHQALANQGFTTVISALPAVYQVVPLAEASQSARVLTDAEYAQLPYPPGFQTVIRDLRNLSADTAMKALSAVVSTPSTQVRMMGPDGRKLLIAAPTQRITEADAILRVIDQPGQVPEVRLFRPERTSAQALQASATGAWNALGRVDEHPRAAEVMIAPDGLQLLLVATSTDIAALEKVARDLDRSEPTEVRTYRPKSFTLEDVASLIQQTLGATSKVEIVRDYLTGSLIIRATLAEHERVAAVVKSIDDAPASSRRQAQSLQVKHRRAEEIARLIMAMISAESGAAVHGQAGNQGAQPPTTQPATASTPVGVNGMSQQPAGSGTGQSGLGPALGGVTGGNSNGLSSNGGLSLPPAVQVNTAPTVATSADGSLVITADPVTNRLLVLGEPRMIEQVVKLVAQVDIYQPQVDLELILVDLTDDQSRNVGVELAKQLQAGNNTSVDITSLFGLSTPVGGSSVNRTIGNASGLGTVVLKPGQYAAVLQALETVNSGHSLIRSQLVVANNAQATLNGVVQEPVSSINSSTQLATTSFAGTSDAGTQITISPQISPADYVTISYAIGQSSFLGNATVTANGVIPPTKRNDNVASTATVPDGYVIALGGLSNRTSGRSESRVPLLGQVPLFGWLFRTRNDSANDSRFYVFIRASILRRTDFADLRYTSDLRAGEADLKDDGEPRLEPEFVK